MKSHKVLCGTIIGLLGLLLSLTVFGMDGRDFPGLYTIRNVTTLPENQVRFTMELQIFNYSEMDIYGAKVMLDKLMMPGESYGTIANVDVVEGSYTDLNQEFTVDQEEYDQWKQGLMPKMTVIFTDLQGNTVYRSIEMVPDFLVQKEAL